LSLLNIAKENIFFEQGASGSLWGFKRSAKSPSNGFVGISAKSPEMLGFKR